MRRALVIGINDYPRSPLFGCVNDAVAVGNLLERNGDGSPNFDVMRLTSDTSEVKADLMNDYISRLFKGDAETVILFFAGHGLVDGETNSGYLVSQDYTKSMPGVSLGDVIHRANQAYPKIQSTVIILDSCHAGVAGELQGVGTAKGEVSVIGRGVTILTASDRDQTASDGSGHGLFTGILLDGLSGGSADILGRITPASVYAHIDQTLGSWEQRPIYKANVQTFVTLRRIAPKVSHEVLQRLPLYFSSASHTFALDPSFEPDRENLPDQFKASPRNSENERIFRELQLCNRHGLIAPLDEEHMYYAAINSKGCRLTALGAHYRKLAEMGRI